MFQRRQPLARSAPRVRPAASVDEAVSLLEGLGADGAILGGGSWILRAPARGEALVGNYVTTRGIAEMAGLSRGDSTRIGALATHAELGAVETGPGALGALAEAARRSAFPAVRHVATIAGNLAARPFPEADLVPALLAGEAVVELAGPAGRDRVDVAAYLATRDRRPAGEVIVAVSLPAPSNRRAWFERLTVRHAAEYSVASVAVSLDVDPDGVVIDARVAVGAVEQVARRVGAAETVLRGSPLGALPATEAGEAAGQALEPRDAHGAPGWYRRAVLPVLFTRVAARMAAV